MRHTVFIASSRTGGSINLWARLSSVAPAVSFIRGIGRLFQGVRAKCATAAEPPRRTNRIDLRFSGRLPEETAEVPRSRNAPAACPARQFTMHLATMEECDEDPDSWRR